MIKKETNKRKGVAEYRTEVRLTKMQHKALRTLGGASAVLKQVIDEKTGSIENLLLLRAEKLHDIQEIDELIKEYEEKIAEEVRQKQEGKLMQKQTTKKAQPNPSPKKRARDIEEMRKRWRGYLESGEWTELSENNYKYIIEALGIQTKEEVDAWLRS